eukprot:3076786-Prymnesium_polylepis.1
MQMNVSPWDQEWPAPDHNGHYDHHRKSKDGEHRYGEQRPTQRAAFYLRCGQVLTVATRRPRERGRPGDWWWRRR